MKLNFAAQFQSMATLGNLNPAVGRKEIGEAAQENHDEDSQLQREQILL